jgi:hypothetical protein
MAFNTYSFSNTAVVIAPPTGAAFTLNGQGIGEITIDWINDNTAHDLAADGTVMVSKITAANANFTVTAQQTSNLHQYLRGLFNALYQGPANQWAATTITITSLDGSFDNVILTGVSFAKQATQPFQAQGQMVSWNMMAANAVTQGSLSGSFINPNLSNNI